MTTTTKISFIKEWDDKQMKDVKNAIVRFIHSRMWTSHHSPDADPFIKSGARNYSAIDNIIGLAYTSTGIYAGLWACNTNLYLNNEQTYYLTGFALDQHSFVHAIFQDNEENEISFPIN